MTLRNPLVLEKSTALDISILARRGDYHDFGRELFMLIADGRVYRSMVESTLGSVGLQFKITEPPQYLQFVDQDNVRGSNFGVEIFSGFETVYKVKGDGLTPEQLLDWAVSSRRSAKW